MKSETRRLLLGSAAGIGAALAARYALTEAQQSTRRPSYSPDRENSAGDGRRNGAAPTAPRRNHR